MSCKTIPILLATLCLSVYSQTNQTKISLTIPTKITPEVAAIAITNGPEVAVTKVRITGDRVSLRAQPDANAELLDRAMRGEELVMLGETNDWVAVQAPDSLDFWVASEYVQNGTVIPDRLNIRSGPSQNYSVVCVASKGDTLSIRGEFNNWIKIAPLAGTRVWVSAEYADIIAPPAPPPAPTPDPEPEPEPEPKVEIKPAPPLMPELSEAERKPLVLILDKKKTQGVQDEIPGILRRSHPGLFKLVLVIDGKEETICLVRGNEQQMESYLNRALLIKGKKYYAEGVDLPVLRVEKIHLDPILRD